MALNAGIIYGFVTSLLLSRFDNPQPTPQFHLELWDLCCSEAERVAIAAPRGHAKSTAVTHAYVLANILFRERNHVMIVSDTESQAISFLGDIKMELLENDELIAAFGIKRLRKDTEAEIIGEMNDGYQFRIIAKGSEQKLRGLKWRHKRPNLVICDDLENDEIVMNEDRREKFRNWFLKALIPAGSDDCLIRVVGTILHMDSMLERLMPPWNDDATKSDGLRFWTERQGLAWKAIRYQAHNPDFSQILWPEKFPKERLLSIRQTYIEQGCPEGYAQEYLNYPIDEEHAFFRKTDFLPLSDLDPGTALEYYVGVDLAISEKDKTAFSVFVVAALTPRGTLRIIEVVRARMDSLEIIDEFFRLHERYNPMAFFLEKENIARSIGPVLFNEMNKRNRYPNVNEDTMIIPSQDKTKRAQSIRMRARAGGVEVDTDAYWYSEFVTELLQFPKSVYKDQTDAFAMIGLGLDKMLEPPTAEELEDERYDQEYTESLMSFEHRNFFTGY